MATINGTNGIDVLSGGAGSDVINGFGSNDYLFGNGGNDTLNGGEGDDTFDGLAGLGAGSDSMTGGVGNDAYSVDNAGDKVIEFGGEGMDKVFSFISSYTLPGNVENLELFVADALNPPVIGIGNTLDNVITGNESANTLSGLDGDDTLNAFGGNDTLNGGNGNDTLDGGRGDNTLYGGSGNDIFQAAYNGTDSMTGGTGNDSYLVDNVGDKVIELATEGTDTVSSKITYTLTANVENLTLTTSLMINGTGNTLANVITGNAAVNVLYGLDGNDTLNGGMGADSMIGGTGNDLYYVDNTGDKVIELTGQGTDTVFSNGTHILAANVENLTLTGTLGWDGTGNALANVMTGNSKANVLSGLAGNDTLVGGAGSDVLIGGTGADRFDFNLVTESTSPAWDAIRSGGGAVAFEGVGVAGGDVIDLSGIDANTKVAGNQAFVFGGTGIGHISLVNSGTTTILNANVDADAAFEFVLAIEDGGVLASTYKAGDFLL